MQRRHLLLAGALSPLFSACTRIPDTIQIGVAQPLSGPLERLGKDMLAGVELAVKDLNKAGFAVNGKHVQLEVLARDDASDAAKGKQVAQELVDAGVVAVIGHLNSGVSIEAAPIYAQAGVAQLAISTNPRYTQLAHPTALRLVANDDMQAKAMASFASTNMQAKRYALVDDATPYGKSLVAGVEAHLQKQSLKATLSASLDAKTTQFDDLVKKMVDAQIDTVITTLADFQVEALIKAMGKAGLSDAKLLAGDTVKTDVLPKLYAAMPIRAVYCTSPVIEAHEFAAGRQFAVRFNAATKKDITYGAHYAYDATHSITEAILRARSVERSKVLAALKQLDLHGPVTASLRYEDNGEQRYGTISVYSIEKGRWTSVMRSAEWT